MKANTRVRSFSIVLILSVLFSLLQSAYVLVQADGANVEVFPLTGFYIEIKITFPSDITGNFAGTLEDKHFDCVTVPTNVLDCIGPYRASPDPSLLTIYNHDTHEIVLQKVIAPPHRPGNDDPEPTIEPPPTVEPTVAPTEPPIDPCEIDVESPDCIPQ